MEPKNEELALSDKIPKERRIRTKETKGEFNEDGFFTTPNGSFWDMDGEYFNHYGFDIHGGKYIDKLDYIPGPTWIEELGCYPEDKDKYQKEDLNDIDVDMDDFNEFDCVEKEEDLNNKMEKLDIKNDINNNDVNINEIKILKKEKIEKKEKKINKKDKKKKLKEESFDEEEWEEVED